MRPPWPECPPSHSGRAQPRATPRKTAWPQALNPLAGLFGLASILCSLTASAAPLEPELEALQAFDQASTEIQARRFERAEILLERVLMLQPEHAAARIELALLMATRGHQDGAMALLQSLIDDPRTPDPQIQELKNLLALIRKGDTLAGRNPYTLGPAALTPVDRLATPAARAARWRGEVSLGQSTNPVARTSAQSIAITLPDGPLILPLAQAQRSGHMLGVNLSHNTDTRGVELAMQHVSVTGTSTAARALAWARLPRPGWTAEADQLPPLLVHGQIQRGLDGQHRAQLGLTLPHGQQKFSLSRYQELSIQDQGNIWHLEHQQPQWAGVDWSLSLERNKSTVGPQGHWRASVTGEYPLAKQAKWLFQWTQQNDTYNYSSLLENGARRHLSTLHVAYEQQHAIGHQKNLYWRVFMGERRSNLSLFAYKEAGVQLGVVHKWP